MLQELLHSLPDGATAEEGVSGAGGASPVGHLREGPAPDAQPTLRGGLPGLLFYPQATGQTWGLNTLSVLD